MKIVYKILELAQAFIEQPKIERKRKDVLLMFDFERDDGSYGMTGIIFKNCPHYNVVKNRDVCAEDIEAYNSIAVEEESKWMSKLGYEKSGEYKHYKIYFDDVGLYEFIAESFVKLDQVDYLEG